MMEKMQQQKSLAEELIGNNIKSPVPFLDLGNCSLTDSSPELEMLADCTHLKGLSLGTEYYDESNKQVNTVNTGRQNIFYTIPRNLPPSLEELQIRNAGISAISNVEHLRQLTLLDLSLNRLERIENLDFLENLKELALHGNFIQRIENLDKLNLLETLHFTRNRLTVLENLNGLKKLVNLYLSVNEIKKIENLGGLTNLYSLDLNMNHIDRIENLEELKGLMVLNLNDNNIRKIENLDRLTQLITLRLERNKIGRIENLESLVSLEYLTLDQNKIAKIENLDSQEKVYFLGLDNNEIEKLENLDKLVNLRNLYIRKNRIKKIENLDLLKKLQIVHLSENEIQKIEPITNIEHLTELFCFANPIDDCPADIWQTNDIKQIRAYFEKTATKGKEDTVIKEKKKTEPEKKEKTATKGKEDTTIKEKSKAEPEKKEETESKKDDEESTSSHSPAVTRDVKLILIGNSNAGKTNLVNYLQTGTYLSERNSTHGLDVIRWHPDVNRFPQLKDIYVSIWDFGGQEYYHDAYRLFLSANAVYIVMWEKDTDKNFRRPTKVTDDIVEDLEHFEKRYWLDTVRHYGPDKKTAPLFLVQNKTDNQSEDKLRISQEMFIEYSLMETYHISLKEGCNAGNKQQVRILQNFEQDIESILLRAADEATTKPSWQIVRTEILRLQENDFNNAGNEFENCLKEDTWIDIADFNKVCKKLTAGTLTDLELFTLPRWLDKCGVVVFFEKNNLLNDKVFINPKKLSEKIYQVLNKEVLSKKGEFSKTELGGSESFKTTFIEAVLALELVFRHPETPDHFIAPQYLPAKHAIEELFRIASANAWQDSYWIKVPLFYYKKLLNQLILKYVGDSNIEARYFWKHGIVFVKNNLRVMIKGLYPNEDESEGVMLVGVENGDAKKTLQKDIFQFIYGFGATPVPIIANTTNQVKQTGVIPVSAEREAPRDLKTDEKFLENIKLSYDNESYESFTSLKSYAENQEQFFINEKTKAKLSLYRFLPVLPVTPSLKPPKKVFVSYSHQNTAWLNKLRIHLSGLKHGGLIDDWTDQEILAGEKWDKKIKENMEQADVFICILSADFVASDYIWNTELKTIFEGMKNRKARAIFIYAEPFDLGSIKGAKISDDLSETSILDFEIIPKDENGHLKAAALWQNENLALTTIVKKIREAIEDKI
jgi:GTPase SAR1 family protein